MEEQAPSILLDVLQIVIPTLVSAILIIGGGLFAYLKYVRDRQRLSSADAEEQQQQWAGYKLKAEQAAWERVRNTIDMQAARIDDQDKRIAELEKKFRKSNECIRILEEKFGECERNVELLEEKNVSLSKENEELRAK
jgi:predicted nuclease with TOPRIM domain